MTFHEELTALLTHLAETLQCGPIPLDDNNVAMLGLDDDLGAVFYAEPGNNASEGAVIISVIAGKPNPDDAELLYDLLCGNYMWNTSGSGNLGIDKESGVLAIHRLVELPIDSLAFEDIFAALVGAARYWRERITPPVGATPPDANTMMRV